MAKKNQAAQPYLVVGQIVAPHGIRGEVKVEVMSDNPDRFKTGAELYLSSTPEGTDARPVKLATSRPHHDRRLVRLSATADRNAAEALRGLYLLIPEAEAMALDEHENFVHDLIGLRVETTAGEPLGEIVEIVFTPANDVYVARGEVGEVLLPATREVVRSVDLAARTMVVELPEGLLAPAMAENATDEPDIDETADVVEAEDTSTIGSQDEPA
jgi:16S rRNA processing protein RimM